MSASLNAETKDEMERALRFAADMVCLWCLCGEAECRRARACRGNVRLCGLRVADWLNASDAKRAAEPGLSEIEMRLETREEFRAYRAWRKALASVLRGERVDPRSGAYEREELKRRVVALQRSMANEREASACQREGARKKES